MFDSCAFIALAEKFAGNFIKTKELLLSEFQLSK